MWQPVTSTIMWFVDPKWDNALFYLYTFGWFLVFAETWVMDHFELTGLKQVTAILHSNT
jgi:hypothetical protein